MSERKCVHCNYPYITKNYCPNCGSKSPLGTSSGSFILYIIIIIFVVKCANDYYSKKDTNYHNKSSNTDKNNHVDQTIIDNQIVKVGDYFQGGIVFFAKNGHVRIVTESVLNFRGIVKSDFEKAKDFCDNLQISNFEDWYLPEYKELNIIMDLISNNPNFKISRFSEDYFLSSNLNDEGQPYVVNINLPPMSGGYINDVEFRILAVRKVGY